MKKIICLLFVVIMLLNLCSCNLIAAPYVIPAIDDNSKNDSIECPDFVGMTIQEVKDNEYYTYFDITWECVSSKEYDVGIVCDQSPSAGKKLKPGAEITLYVIEE